LISVEVAWTNCAVPELNETKLFDKTGENPVPCTVTVSIPATALPAGKTDVIVGLESVGADGSNRLALFSSSQPLMNKNMIVMTIENDVDRKDGYIGGPAFLNDGVRTMHLTEKIQRPLKRFPTF
jgi:hypothetical protein